MTLHDQDSVNSTEGLRMTVTKMQKDSYAQKISLAENLFFEAQDRPE